MTGFITIERNTWDHPILARSEMSETEAWFWMIARASWAGTQHRVGSSLVDVDRGSFMITLREMQAVFMWGSDKRVRNFMKKLEKHGMIAVLTLGERNARKTHVTIRNYNEYQSSGRSKDAAKTHEGRSKDAVKNKVTKEQGNNKKEDTNVSLLVPIPKEPDRFDEFWEMYPRNVGRAAAKKKYDAALKKHRHDDIMFGLSQHLPDLSTRETQFIPHAATWLHGERFNDEPEPHNNLAGSRDTGTDATTRAISNAGRARRTPSKDCF